METLTAVIAVILGLLGIIGSFVPVLPGPPLSWLAMLLLYISGGTDRYGAPMSLRLLVIWLIITVAVTIADYLFPAWITRKTGGSRYAGGGAVAGALIGVFVPPVGIILGVVLGAFLAELLFAKRDIGASLKSALGAFLGFILGTGAKLASAAIMLYYIFVYIR